MNPSDVERADLPLQVWLDVLSAVAPPRGTLVIGAGIGTGQWVQWLRRRNVRPVWLVEGDEGQYQHLLRSLPVSSEWTPRRDVVATNAEAAIFHRMSNPAESGLLGAEHLHGLWPRLTSEGEVAVETAVTLDQLLADACGDVNWLVLDCLPAAALLRGGERLLAGLDVLLLRVAISGSAMDASDASHATVAALLQTAGFQCIQLHPERHPALAHVLYVRDLRKLVAAGEQAAADAERLRVQAKADRRALALAQQKSQTLDAEVTRLQEAVNAQTASRPPAPPQLFSLPVKVGNACVVQLAMNPSRRGWVQVKEDHIDFSTEKDAPLYIVGCGDGDFNKPPSSSPFRVEKNASYVLTGHLECKGPRRPQIWVFQYSEMEKIDARSGPVDEEGSFQLNFTVFPAAQSITFGVRVSGMGQLMPGKSFAVLSEQSGEDWAPQSQEIDSLRRENERLGKKLVALRSSVGDFGSQPNYSALDSFIKSLDEKALEEAKNRSDGGAGIVLQQARDCLIGLTKGDSEADLVLNKVVTSSGPIVLAHVADDYIPTKIVREEKYYELDFLKALARLHNPDTLILDVGANIGNHTLYFSLVCGAKVVAFEPEPHNVLCLELNVHLNNVADQVTVHRCALGREFGAAALTMTLDANYGSFSAAFKSELTRSSGGNGLVFSVPVRAMDEVLAEHHLDKAVSLLKIDVEGMEIEVLQGAVSTIRRWTPFIACECVDQVTFEKVEGFLSTFGYSVAVVFNATPTFIFICAQSEFHLSIFSKYMREEALSKAGVKKGFFNPKSAHVIEKDED